MTAKRPSSVWNRGPAHRRLRDLVNKAFAAHGVEFMRSAIDGIVSEYGDELNERSELDPPSSIYPHSPA